MGLKKKSVEHPSEMPALSALQGSAESLDASIRRAQETLSAVSARLGRRGLVASPAAERFVETEALPLAEARDVAERCIAGETPEAASVARAFAALLGQIDALENDHVSRRRVLRQWMVSQLTYRMLYLHHTGQAPTVPPRALRAQKEQVREQITALLDAGRAYTDIRLADLRFSDDGSAGGAS